jgi:hypothetical protein
MIVMISLFRRMSIITIITLFFLAVVEFALIQKREPTVNTFIVVIITAFVPAALAMLVNLWYYIPKYMPKERAKKKR